MEKKETPKFSDKQLDDMALEEGKKVNKQSKVRVRIPINPLNKEDLVVPVNVNGYNYFIKRGESVEVPEVVANILEEAGYI